MTFQGMLKILVNDYKKQHEGKIVSIVEELMRTRHELQEVKEKLQNLELGASAPSTDPSHTPAPTIRLFVQYDGFFNELCDIRQTMTIKDLLGKLRQITGIPLEHPIHLRVLSEDGSRTLFFLHGDLDRTLGSFDDQLKPRMILSIEDDDVPDMTARRPSQRSKGSTCSERTYSYESDV